MRRALSVGLVVVFGWCGAAVAQPKPAVLLKPAEPVAGPAVGPPPEQVAFQRAVNSQVVVSGVVSMGKATVELAMYPGQPVKTTYKVATIAVNDTLIGDKLGDKVTVLIPPADVVPIPYETPGRPQPYFRPAVVHVQLIDGQEGVFFLTLHPSSADQYQIPIGGVPLNPLDSDHKETLAAVKKVGAVIADPMKALKAKEAADRYEAAVVLVNRYRRAFSPGNILKEEKAVPAEESKLIMTAIAEFDWASFDKPFVPGETPRDYTKQPNTLLTLLGIHQGQNGFPQVRANPGQGFHAAYKQAFADWRDGPGAKFEVKKYVPVKK